MCAANRTCPLLPRRGHLVLALLDETALRRRGHDDRRVRQGVHLDEVRGVCRGFKDKGRVVLVLLRRRRRTAGMVLAKLARQDQPRRQPFGARIDDRLASVHKPARARGERDGARGARIDADTAVRSDAHTLALDGEERVRRPLGTDGKERQRGGYREQCLDRSWATHRTCLSSCYGLYQNHAKKVDSP